MIIESKSVAKYLRQVEAMGGNVNDYKSIWGYSMSETEARTSIFDYPANEGGITKEITNLKLKS